jgi:hypothetical protein
VSSGLARCSHMCLRHELSHHRIWGKSMQLRYRNKHVHMALQKYWDVGHLCYMSRGRGLWHRRVQDFPGQLILVRVVETADRVLELALVCARSHMGLHSPPIDAHMRGGFDLQGNIVIIAT